MGMTTGARSVDGLKNLIDGFLVQRKDDMIRWAMKFIEIPTQNPPGEQYELFCEVGLKLFKMLDLAHEVLDVPLEQMPTSFAALEPRIILLAGIGPADGQERELHFNGHYDVVPAPGIWEKTQPFTPMIKQGKLFGRGAVDMKSALVSMAFTLAAVQYATEECGLQLPGRISLSYVPDEEVGGATGTRHLLRSGKIAPTLCVVGEPTGLGNIWVAHKGRIEGRIVVRGRQAHGSVPWEGENAFRNAANLLLWLEEHYAKKLAGRKSIWHTDGEASGAPTVLFGGVAEGGAKATVVPHQFSFSFDRRILPEESPEAVLSELEQYVFGGARRIGLELNQVEFEGRIMRFPCIGGADDRLVRYLQQAAVEVLETEDGTHASTPRPVLGPGGTDLSHFVEHGIPGVVYGPGEWEQAHTQDEHICVDQIVDAARIYARFAIDYLFRGNE